MPRIRYLKPDFFKDDDLGKLPPLFRLAFAGLWCHADKEGRLKDRPQQLKVEILPYDDLDFDLVLKTLSEKKPINNTRSFITRYEVAGEKYIQINKFRDHQKPHHTEKDSVIPPFLTVITRLKHRDAPVGMEKGMEKGMDIYGQNGFDQFWSSYPKKLKKKDALKIWQRLKPSQELAKKIIEAIEKAKDSVEWTKDNGQFIPHPTTYLNQQRWEDELTPKPKAWNE